MKKEKKDSKSSYSEQRLKIKEVFYKLSKGEQADFRAKFDKEFGINRLREMLCQKPKYIWHEWHLKFFAVNLFHCSLADMMELDFDFVPANVQIKARERKFNARQPKITQHSQASLFILANPDHEKRSKRSKTTISAEVQRSEEVL